MTNVAVFTELNDARTPDRRTLQRLRAAAIPVIPVSTLTLDEIAPIAADLRLRGAMIVEAGGAIARWTEDGWRLESCGPSADMLLDVVMRIEDRARASLLVISAREGAPERRFSEPFAIESGDVERIRRTAARLGFAIRRGPRYFHLSRECNRGEAFTRLREELGCETAIGIGSSPIDADFLSRVDIPIALADADPDLLATVPSARIAPNWNDAVEEGLRLAAAPKRRMRRVAAG